MTVEYDQQTAQQNYNCLRLFAHPYDLQQVAKLSPRQQSTIFFMYAEQKAANKKNKPVNTL